MTTTTESQITSGKAESTIDTLEFDQLLEQYFEADHSNHQRYRAALIAHIEAVREKDREEAKRLGWDSCNEAWDSCIEANSVRRLRERCDKAEAERDHFKAIAERQAAGLSSLERYNCSKDWMRLEKEGQFVRFDDVAALLSPAQQEPAKDDYEQCPKCAGSRVLGEVRGVRCTNCNGRGYVAASATDAGQELKNCFCGGKPVIQKLHDGWQNWIECGDCSNETARKGTLEQAKEEWQRIATPAQATPEGGYEDTTEHKLQRAKEDLRRLVQFVRDVRDATEYNPTIELDDFPTQAQLRNIVNIVRALPGMLRQSGRETDRAYEAGKQSVLDESKSATQEGGQQANPHFATFPDKIWLQVGDCSEDETSPYDEVYRASEMTWSADIIDHYDVGYVRADLAASQQAAEPVAWLKEWNSVGGARTGMRRVDLTPECELWLANMFPTITPLYRAAPLQQVEKDN